MQLCIYLITDRYNYSHLYTYIYVYMYICIDEHMATLAQNNNNNKLAGRR